MKAWTSALIVVLCAGLLSACDEEQEGPTSFWQAICHGKIDILERYLQSGIDVNAPLPEDGLKGFTPLTVALDEACQGSRKDAVRMLIAHGADVNKASPNGDIPVVRAAVGLDLENLILLLESGADPDKEDENGETAIMRVAGRGGDNIGPRIIQALLDHGADACRSDSKGRPAYASALESGHPEIADVIKEARCRCDAKSCGDE